MIVNKESLLAILKKLKALSCSILWRFPSKKVKAWAENEAIFQRTRPVAFDDMNFDNDPHLISLKKAFGDGLLKEIDVMDQRNNIRLHAWFLKPHNNMPSIIYSYGNSANLSESRYLMNSFAERGFGFLGWSYPGYEHSEGCPSEQKLCDGLKSMSDCLNFTHGIQPFNQIAMGHSLGGLISVEAATKIQFRLIVLIATPPSIPDYYEHLLKSVPLLIRWMCTPKEKITQHFDALSKMPLVKSPVLFVYGDKDEEIPLDMVRKLFRLSKTPNYENLINGAPHDLEMIPIYAEEICRTVCLYDRNKEAKL